MDDSTLSSDSEDCSNREQFDVVPLLWMEVEDIPSDVLLEWLSWDIIVKFSLPAKQNSVGNNCFLRLSLKFSEDKLS